MNALLLWRRANTSGETLTSAGELTQGMKSFTACCAQAEEPSALPSSKQARQRLAGALPKMPLWGKTVGNFRARHPSVPSLFSFFPYGLQASILMCQSTQSPAPARAAWWIAPLFVATRRKKKYCGLYIHRGQRHQCVDKTNELNLGSVASTSVTTSEQAANWLVRCLFHLFHIPSKTACKVNRKTHAHHQTVTF